MGKVIDLQKTQPDWALERLNRMTGLTFSSVPKSLVNSTVTQSLDAKKPAFEAGFSYDQALAVGLKGVR